MGTLEGIGMYANSNKVDFSLSAEMREMLAGYLHPEEPAPIKMAFEIDETLDAVERVVFEYLEDLEENPDEVLPKPSDAYRQLMNVAKKFSAAAYAIEDKEEVISDTSAASESREALSPVLSEVLALGLPDEILNSSRAPEPHELLAYARRAKELSRYFKEQGSYRKQKPLHRRDVLMHYLITFFLSSYRNNWLLVGGKGWQRELLDNCEGFVHCILTEAGIPCPEKSDPDRIDYGELKQGRLRRMIKNHLPVQ